MKRAVSRLALCLMLAGAFASLSWAGAPPSAAEAQRARGEVLYAENCAVCHGATAMGFAEARAAFPEDHQRCERCHKSNNPRQMTLEQMAPNNAFPVGNPPALRGEGVLASYPNAAVLYHYLRATMPRHEPGRLSDEDYLAITAFLLALGGNLQKDVVLDEESAPFFGPGGN